MDQKKNFPDVQGGEQADTERMLARLCGEPGDNRATILPASNLALKPDS
jgi:hypothetical protein